MRLFIAVPLPGALKDSIAAVQERLRKVPVDVSWADADKFHLTLKFLGDVSDDMVEQVVATVSAAVRGCAPFEITLRGLGAFPDMRLPRVIWAGVSSGEEPLRGLAGKIDAALVPLGYEREKRGFTGHLTLGRVRSKRNLEALVKRVDSLKDSPFGSCPVDSVHIIRSILHPQGPEYQCLKSISI